MKNILEEQKTILKEVEMQRLERKKNRSMKLKEKKENLKNRKK